MGEARSLQPVPISDFGIGPVIHIKDYRLRRNSPIPLCRVSGWENILWEVDKDKGNYGKPCGRCRLVWDRLRATALEKERARYKVKNARVRSTPERREADRERSRQYYRENKRVAKKKEKIRYWKDPEKARKRIRQKYQKNIEVERAKKRAYWTKNKEAINIRRRELYRLRREEQGN